jgi:hypothetical protein
LIHQQRDELAKYRLWRKHRGPQQVRRELVREDRMELNRFLSHKRKEGRIVTSSEVCQAPL